MAKNASAVTYERQLQANVNPSASLTTSAQTGGGMFIRVPCAKCGDTKNALHMIRKLPPDQVAKRLKNKGWELGPRRSICPMHEPERKEPIMVETTAPTPPVPVAPASVVSASDAAKRARREVIMLLDEVFDAEAGAYRKGESDASVAETVGIAENAVAALRVEFYGDLKTPPELQNFVRELAALKADAIGEKAAAVKAYDATVANYDAALAKIRAFANARGWKIL